MDRTKTRAVSWIGVLIAGACCVSCGDKGEQAVPAQNAGQVTVTRTSDGATIRKDYSAHAVVSAIDHAARNITLTTDDGRVTTFRAGDEVRNFERISVGDHVTARIWEELAVHLTGGKPASTQAQATLAAGHAAPGAKPSAYLVSTVEEIATVTALNRQSRQATLQFPSGQWQSIQVGENVDLTKVKPGDTVAVRHTEGASIKVEGK